MAGGVRRPFGLLLSAGGYLIIEDYGRFLKKKGAKQLSEEQSRVEPFSASMLDGIDMRETLRNSTRGRSTCGSSLRVQGGVGSVVVIFDEDRGRENVTRI